MNFGIDIAHKTLILFENAVEIYGDIRGADNSFKIQAYEQGTPVNGLVRVRIHNNVLTLAWLDL